MRFYKSSGDTDLCLCHRAGVIKLSDDQRRLYGQD